MLYFDTTTFMSFKLSSIYKNGFVYEDRYRFNSNLFCIEMSKPLRNDKMTRKPVK